MKKIALLVILAAMTFNISAQIFLGTIASTGSNLQFKIKPTGSNITSAIGYFEFCIRYSSSTNITFGSLILNTANTNPATGFPGASFSESTERIFGGFKYKRFIATVTIPTQTYLNGTEYTVFEIRLSSSVNPLEIQLATNYDSTVPNDYYFAVSDGSGNPLVDVAGINNFYPTQTKNGSEQYFSLMNIVLPIELLSFQGEQTKGGNLLTWQTANEINSNRFDIEWSADGTHFPKIGEVKAQGKGSAYEYLDKTPRNISSYYRLKIHDLDESFHYSKTIFLEQTSEKKIKIHWRTEGMISIETSDRIESVIVTNLLGQVQRVTKEKRFSIADLPTAIYVVSVKTDRGYLSEKVFKE